MKTHHKPLIVARIAKFASLLAIILGVGLITSCGQSDVRVVEPTGVVDRYVVASGTYQRVMRGEIVQIIPRKLEVHVGDEIIIENQDNITHMIGPFTVRAGETLRHVWASTGTIEGDCTFIPDQKVTIRVLPQTQPRTKKSFWPEIQVENVDGATVDTADFKSDKVLVVTLWSTWCVPCRRELPQLQKFAEANSSVSIVAVNLGDDAPSVRAYANELGLTMPILLDAYGRISSAVGVASVPATILIRDKQVVATHLGEISAKELVEFVSQNS